MKEQFVGGEDGEEKRYRGGDLCGEERSWSYRISKLEGRKGGRGTLLQLALYIELGLAHAVVADHHSLYYERLWLMDKGK